MNCGFEFRVIQQMLQLKSSETLRVLLRNTLRDNWSCIYSDQRIACKEGFSRTKQNLYKEANLGGIRYMLVVLILYVYLKALD